MENTSHSPEEIKKMRDIAIKYMKELHKQSGNTTKENKNSPIKNVKKQLSYDLLNLTQLQLYSIYIYYNIPELIMTIL